MGKEGPRLLSAAGLRRCSRGTESRGSCEWPFHHTIRQPQSRDRLGDVEVSALHVISVVLPVVSAVQLLVLDVLLVVVVVLRVMLVVPCSWYPMCCSLKALSCS